MWGTSEECDGGGLRSRKQVAVRQISHVCSWDSISGTYNAWANGWCADFTRILRSDFGLRMCRSGYSARREAGPSWLTRHTRQGMNRVMIVFSGGHIRKKQAIAPASGRLLSPGGMRWGCYSLLSLVFPIPPRPYISSPCGHSLPPLLPSTLFSLHVVTMTVGIMPSSHYLARFPDEDDGDADAQMEDLLDEARRYHPDSPKTPLRRPAPEQHLPPVVLVEGFFSFFNEVRLSRPFPYRRLIVTS
jgi:hypothetical protein